MTGQTITALYPATPAQQGFLLGTLTSPDDGLFVEQAAFPLRGVLDLARLRHACATMIADHEILRTGFAWDLAADPQQVVLDRAEVTIDMVDGTGLDPGRQEENLRELLRTQRREPFDLTRPPLLRLAVHRLASAHHQLVWTHHHGILDGWAHLMLVRELLLRYNTGAASDPDPQPFGRYALWLAERPGDHQRAHWREHLDGYVPPPPLASRPAPAERFGQHGVTLPGDEAAALRSFARARGVTPAAALLACWGVIAARQRGRDDIAVGVTVSGRSHPFPGAATLAGPLATTVPLRLARPPHGRAGDWIGHVQDLLARADRDSACSTADIHAWAGLPEDRALYDSVVSIADYPHPDPGDGRPHPPGALRLDPTGIRSDGGRTRHPLVLVVETFAGLRLRLVNDRSRVDDTHARATLACLRRMLSLLRPETDPPIADLAAQTAGLAAFDTRSPEPPPSPSPQSPPSPSPQSPPSPSPQSPPSPSPQFPLSPPSPPSPSPGPATGAVTGDGTLPQVVTDAFAAVLGRPVSADTDFLAAGGHSLLALRLIARLRAALAVDLTLGDLLRSSTPRTLSSRVRELLLTDAAPPDPLPPLTPGPGETDRPFPLTGIQQAYWAGRDDGFDLGGVDSHLYTEADIPGLDLERLAAVWRALIDRHAMLRAVITEDGRQRILPSVPPYRIRTFDLRTAADADARLAGIRERLSHARRDTAVWPLFTVEAALLPGGVTRLFLSFDLLIGDALSWQILYREAHRLYRDPGVRLPALPLTFADYVAHLPAVTAGGRYDRDRRYWRGRLADLPAPPALPVVPRMRSAARPRFTRLQATLPGADLGALRDVAAAHGSTLSTLLLAAFGETLGRFTNTTAFLVNVTVYNRLDVHPRINAVVGDFTSTVLTAVDLTGPTFADRLRTLQRRLWDDLDHSLYSGVEVLRDLRERTADSTAAAAPVVFTSTLDLETPADEAPDPFPGTIGYGIGQTPQVLFDYQTYEVAGRLVVNFDTVAGLLPEGFVQDMLDDHTAGLRALIDHADAPQRPRLTVPPAPPPLPPPLGGERLLHEPFLEQARRHPGRTAVVSDGRRVTYAELRERARLLAARIAAAHPGGELVALLCEPGPDQAAAALGVLIAGHAFVPVDPAWPRQRVLELLSAAGASVVVTQRAVAARTGVPDGVHVILADEEEHPGTGPAAPAHRPRTAGDLAYVIYTSGSTGRPKGVMIPHRGALNTILDVNQRFGVGPDDTLLAVSPFTFDLAVYDLFGALAAGATVVVPTRDQRTDPSAWIRLARDENVTVWNSVPVLMELLLDALPDGDALPGNLRLCLLSGDWIPLELPGRVRARARDCRVISLGGATEGSIWSILHEVEHVDPGWASIPYGTPMTGQSVEILDDRLLPCPVWTPGQIHIGGHGTALGYWDAPDLTREAFVFDGRTGRRLYRTGDWGRRRADGELEFLGRRDAQVKIGGYRVELREVEAALAAIAGVDQAAVVVTGERADRRLAGFVVTSRPVPGIRTELARLLPGHMLPATLVALPELPLNSTSKIDRAALARTAAATAATAVADAGTTTDAATDPTDTGTDAAMPPEAATPETTTAEPRPRTWERRLLDALEDLLPGRPGLDDDLLALGLTSVDVIRLANAVQRHSGRRPDLAAFYDAPTLRTIVEQAGPAAVPAPGGSPATPWTGWTPLTDPDDRAAFRSTRPAYPPAPATRVLPGNPPRRMAARARRATPRSFTGETVPATALADLLDSMRRTDAGGRPAFLYPSAGGLYATQVHVHLRPGRVEGITGGLYTYHPDAHDLILQVPDVDLDTGIHVGPVNRPVARTAAFTLFLTTDPADSAPLYGAEAEPLALLTAGYMGQLLCQTAVTAGLGLCPVHGIDFDAVRWLFPHGDRLVLLHTLLGGVPARSGPPPVFPEDSA
ncbi:amino acid adenylation domain-containing protein [Streptosporangium becharense]|uniref:Phenyloxazoline synthase MbtB n=1 Tax=Streptosporangium becharense TaxID=1816182 RepID=A0A7W9IAS5_9ACTN|nr:non-ribosomal peptide synthetase [Streptosporangium becharense]MBB2910616.1 amino acid adenylation domain-containing protein [Streptosporangium becharense]MBB5817312.1 amino acid adenylation domain-containing protein [Streptosporangium becharense]